MTWIQTGSGAKVDCLAPMGSSIHVEDVATGLSRMPRFNGHTYAFYSVAQHSVLLAKHLVENLDDFNFRMGLVALLHDASEAYLADLASPYKENLPEYRKVEDRLLCVIYQALTPLSIKEIQEAWPLIKGWDRRLCFTEAMQLHPAGVKEWGWRVAPVEMEIKPWSMGLARQNFLNLYEWLLAKITGGLRV
jgi:hypothetical protein